MAGTVDGVTVSQGESLAAVEIESVAVEAELGGSSVEAVALVAGAIVECEIVEQLVVSVRYEVSESGVFGVAVVVERAGESSEGVG